MTRLLRLGEFDAPISLTLSPRPYLRRHERWHPEREVDAAVHARLLVLFGEAVVPKYRGWRGTNRAAAIPDFLVLDQPAATGVIVVEVKARPTLYSDIGQLAGYVNRALDTFPGPVVAVLAAPRFSAFVPEWITRWHLELEQAVA